MEEKDPYPGITQNGRLPKIPSDMSPRKRYLFRLKKQPDPSDLLAIALQPFFSKLSTIFSVALCNHVAGGSMDLVQRGGLIAKPLAHLL